MNYGSGTISMVVEKWQEHQIEQFSTVHHIYGYPWRLRLYQGPKGNRVLSLVCDKSSESELWECTATITAVGITARPHTFTSWDKASQQHLLGCGEYKETCSLAVDITTINIEKSWRLRPSPNLFEPRDGIFLTGEEKQKIYVNKKDLASQSPYFDKLFFGDFKEKNMSEIPIGDVEYEEFVNIIRMVYNVDGARLDKMNVRRVLQLADRFDITIVEDRVVSFLLSSSSLIPTTEKLLISEMYNLPFLKEKLLSRDYTNAELKELSNSDDLRSLSVDTIVAQLMYKRKMSAPLEDQESTTISLVVEKWNSSQIEQFSLVYRINGSLIASSRLRLYPAYDGDRKLALVCDKSSESELWQCSAHVKMAPPPRFSMRISYSVCSASIHAFNSWDKASKQCILAWGRFDENSVLKVELKTNDDGERWRIRSILDPIEAHDAILLIGEEKTKVYVSKRVLSSQSNFFDKLFNGDFKEKNMSEIPIGDVEYEEFCNLIRIVYGFNGAELTDENMHRTLQLADRFALKIVEDRVVSHLLSSSCLLSTAQKLLFSEQYNLPFAKDQLLSRDYSNAELKELGNSEEVEQLSAESARVLFQKSSQQLA